MHLDGPLCGDDCIFDVVLCDLDLERQRLLCLEAAALRVNEQASSRRITSCALAFATRLCKASKSASMRWLSSQLHRQTL
jgi:hypothetical protein